MGKHMRLWNLSHVCQASLNTHADVLSVARGLNFGLSLRLHTNFVYVSSYDSGESAHLCRLA